MTISLFGPETLRSKAGQLRTDAASVAVALDNVDQQMRNLNSSFLTNRRADNLRCRYESQRQQLMNIPGLLTGFAQSLEQAAEIFEQSTHETHNGFDWTHVLQEVNRYANQSYTSFRSRFTPLPPGIPRWYEWGQDTWQAFLTPVAKPVRHIAAGLLAEAAALGSSSLPAQPAAPGAELLAHQPDDTSPLDQHFFSQANADDIYKMNIEPAWSFSSIELFFLGGWLGLPGFLGIADPFSGCVDDDLKVYMQLAYQSLRQRGYLIQAAGGEQLDPALNSLLHMVASASQVLIAVQGDSFVIVYLSPESIVLQQPLPEHQVGFFLLENLSAIVPHLQNLLSSSPLTPAPRASVTVAQPVLEYARAMLADAPSAEKIAVCAASLTQAGLPPESATAFALALARPTSAGYLALLQRDGALAQRQSGCAWLVGTSGGWITRLPPASIPALLTWHPLSSPVASFAVEQILDPHLCKHDTSSPQEVLP